MARVGGKRLPSPLPLRHFQVSRRGSPDQGASSTENTAGALQHPSGLRFPGKSPLDQVMPLSLGGFCSLPSRRVDCVWFQIYTQLTAATHCATHSRAALAQTAGTAERVIREAQFASLLRHNKDPCSTIVRTPSGAHHHLPFRSSNFHSISSLHLLFPSLLLFSLSWTKLFGERSRVHLFIPSSFSSFTSSVCVGADWSPLLFSSFNLLGRHGQLDSLPFSLLLSHFLLSLDNSSAGIQPLFSSLLFDLVSAQHWHFDSPR
eukprot:840756-Rhodomonas_salina.1